MIGLSVIEETNQIIHNYQEKEQLSELIAENNKVIMDHFDFDQSTLTDFIDYIEFQGYEQYVFFVIGEVNRTVRIASFLQDELDHIQFSVIDNQLQVLYGDPSVATLFKGKWIDRRQVRSQSNSTEYLKNGIMAMFTGFYPENLNKNILKHLYIQNEEILEKISKDVFMNIAINSSIFVRSHQEKSLNEFPFIMIEGESIEHHYLEEFIQLDKNEVLSMLDEFKNSGVVRNPYSKKGIFDYSLLVERHTNNRLFFYEDGIYHDYGKKYLITQDLSSNYFNISSQSLPAYSAISNYDQVVKSIFPLMFHLTSYFQVPESKFITPYSRIHFDPITDQLKNLSWVGIENEKGKYVFNLNNKKMYETEALFLEIMEADQKDCLDELRKQHTNIENMINQYREIVNHA
ncbi:hypothetical protein [Pallidibacillus thermolactis]|uniref:hypothetical protein n=1 Tax=Pallidibacillus thermolactis TaxID=251051 RepID=UPI0021D9CFF1|nr:hypothetical protein [Pallidibacillus thermolactis]MCU9600459.1 hypothetical protein [Pallidibacillus thermolactis subsp. kokeshiiformis]